MEKQNSSKALEEMNEFLSTAADAASGENSADDDGLPFEPLEAFNTDPIDFGEMSERMLRKVEDVFDLTRMYNRQSAKYLKACAILEKGIKYLAVCCLTRIALKLHDHPYPNLEQLTTQKLYGMVSGNFRKLDDALTEKQQQAYDLYPDLMDMHTRYFNLLLRLRSTEDKIYRFHFQKYYEKENYTPVVEGLAFTEKSWARSYTSKREEPPAFRKAPAFPIAKSAAGSCPPLRSETETVPQAEKHITASADDVLSFKCPALPAPAADLKSTKMESAEPAIPAGSTAPDSTAQEQTNRPEITPAEPVRPAEQENHQAADAPFKEPPAFWEIIQNAMGRVSDKDEILFTPEEMHTLVSDPEFCRFDPGCAQEIRRYLFLYDT